MFRRSDHRTQAVVSTVASPRCSTDRPADCRKSAMLPGGYRGPDRHVEVEPAPDSSGGLKCPCPRRREPGRCLAMAATPSAQPTAPCRPSEGPKAPPWAIGTATLITFLSCRLSIREARAGPLCCLFRAILPPILYPGGNRSEGYRQTEFFAEYYPDSGKLNRCTRRPLRRERGR
jgi:hypothetical protein